MVRRYGKGSVAALAQTGEAESLAGRSVRVIVVPNVSNRPVSEEKVVAASIPDGHRSVGHSDDISVETDLGDGLGVDVVDPFVGRLPDDRSHPEGKVRCHKVHESKPERELKAIW